MSGLAFTLEALGDYSFFESFSSIFFAVELAVK